MSWNSYFISSKFEKKYTPPKGVPVSPEEDKLEFKRWGREYWPTLRARRHSIGRDQGNLVLHWENYSTSTPQLNIQWDSWNGFETHKVYPIQKLSATIQCSKQKLLTPKQWEVKEDTFMKGNLLSPFSYQETGKIEKGLIQRKVVGMAKPHSPQPPLHKNVTCDWLLFSQLAHYAKKGVESLEYDMLEGLALVRRNQQLQYRGQSTVSVGDYTFELHEYEQLGQGVLSTTYWFDQSFRPMFIVSGCCYLYYLHSIIQKGQ